MVSAVAAVVISTLTTVEGRIHDYSASVIKGAQPQARAGQGIVMIRELGLYLRNHTAQRSETVYPIHKFTLLAVSGAGASPSATDTTSIHSFPSRSHSSSHPYSVILASFPFWRRRLVRASSTGARTGASIC